MIAIVIVALLCIFIFPAFAYQALSVAWFFDIPSLIFFIITFLASVFAWGRPKSFFSSYGLAFNKKRMRQAPYDQIKDAYDAVAFVMKSFCILFAIFAILCIVAMLVLTVFDDGSRPFGMNLATLLVSCLYVGMYLFVLAIICARLQRLLIDREHQDADASWIESAGGGLRALLCFLICLLFVTLIPFLCNIVSSGVFEPFFLRVRECLLPFLLRYMVEQIFFSIVALLSTGFFMDFCRGIVFCMMPRKKFTHDKVCRSHASLMLILSVSVFVALLIVSTETIIVYASGNHVEPINLAHAQLLCAFLSSGIFCLLFFPVKARITISLRDKARFA